MSFDAHHQLRAAAAEVGAVDVLVFRRLSGATYAHLGGIGRGEGWAGIVDVCMQDEPLAIEAMDSPGRLARYHGCDPGRIIGPYYARDAALVRVDGDLLVAFGTADGSDVLSGTPPLTLLASASMAADCITEVSPTKRLADEVEVLTAVREMSVGSPETLDETLRHVVQVATSALSCDVGLVVTADGHGAMIGEAQGVVVDLVAVREALAAARGPVCVQDSTTHPLPAPLSPADGVRAWLSLPLPEPTGGLLLVGHTEAGPRGFTDLCQRLGVQLAEAAAMVIHVAQLRDNLERELERQAGNARRDPLTDVLNRRGWDEAVSDLDIRYAGRPISVISVDVDGLKERNDEHGHHAGDRLLRRVADILRDNVREDDVVARLGGDEFCVLLPDADEQVAEDVASRIREVGTMCVSVGVASCANPGELQEALVTADARMYQEKRRNRAALRAVPQQSRRASGAASSSDVASA